jgi:flotillin
MSHNYLTILAALVVVFIVFLQMIIILSRYTKVAPNQVLIVSGRKRHLPDGRVLGYRIVKGGGTFVLPVIEKVDVLSLDAVTIELPHTRAQSSNRMPVEVDCAAQVKINGDDASLVPAMEFFLGKNPAQMQNIIRPILEKYLVETLCKSNANDIAQNPVACAAAIQSACAGDLARMGLSVVSVSLRNVRNP